MAQGIDAFLFDLDGTLALTEFQRNRPANETVARDHGAEIRPEDWTILAGTSEKRIWEHLRDRFNHFALDEQQYTALVEQRFYANMHKVKIRPGMQDVFTHAANTNIPMAVGTNSPRALAEATLKHTGQIHAMKAVVTKCDALENQRPGKPHPDIFLMAAARLGVDASNCAYFEDSRNGVYAALQALNHSGRKGSGLVIQIIDPHDEHQAVPADHEYVRHASQIIHIRSSRELVHTARKLAP